MNSTYWIPFNETERGTQIVDDVTGDDVWRTNDGRWVLDDGRGPKQALEENRPDDWVPKLEKEEIWYINDQAKGENPRLVQAEQDKSIIVLGETGSGKTEAIKLLINQFAIKNDNPLIIFDYKDDYKKFFANYGNNSELIKISLSGSDKVWNIFNEVESEEDFEEIGRVLFKKDEQQSQNPFFPQAARQLFVAICKYLYRWTNDDPTAPRRSNKLLVDQIENHDINYWYELLTSGPEEDEFDMDWVAGLTGAVSTINPEGSRQAVSVFSHLQTTVNEVFKGDFAAKGDFSVRDYVDNPQGHTLVLDYPLGRGETVKPVYRFYIDWAIRHALQDDSTESYFVLDEFQTIPGLEKIERLVNAGRARKAYSVLGLQSVAQLQMTYGEEHARSILSGLAQEVLLRSGDKQTTDYVRDRLAQKFVARTVEDATPPERTDSGNIIKDPNNKTTIKREEYQVSEREVQQLKPGEAFVVLPERLLHGQLMMIEYITRLGRLSGLADKVNPK